MTTTARAAEVFADYREEQQLSRDVADARQQLKAANGRRRERTIELEQMERAAADLTDGEFELLLGGTVANSYGYAAKQTAVLVFRIHGFALAIIRVANAKKGCSGFGDIIHGNRLQKPLLDLLGDAALIS